MRLMIRDRDALQAITPDALSAYARSYGWSKVGTYGECSDIYTAEKFPELILPRTQRLGDYASVVAQIIKILTRVSEQDEVSLYKDLMTANRDVVRVRVDDGGDGGSLSINSGVDLIDGSRDMLEAVACSLREPQPLYRVRANREARDLLNQVRLAQTEYGSFVVSMWTPVVPPPIPELFPEHVDPHADQPIVRSLTRRLTEALEATRRAAKNPAEDTGWDQIVQNGVSANLCESLVKLITPFTKLDVIVKWALTRPMTTACHAISFANADITILSEAARMFRSREPKPDETLVGFVRRLGREETQVDGTIGLSTSIDGHQVSVTVMLKQSDYERAIQAHQEKSVVVIRGDLERGGQRWRLLNPSITDIINNDTQDE